MGQISVNFNNQEHHLACQDGGEERLKMLAEYIDRRAGNLVDKMGPVGDLRYYL